MNYEEALKLATEMHDGQKRKITGENYIIHPLAVANKFIDEDYKIVSILHDTIEKTSLTFDDLKILNLSSKLINCVDLLSRYPNELYLNYILKLKENKMARLIKIEDLTHNLINPLSLCQKDKYIMALYILNNNEE